MPFTFSHPAIILPFNRVKHLSISGLIAGSVSPDFEYYIRMTDKRVYTHTWSGLIYFDLPLALLLIFIFHNLVRNHLIDNSPKSIQTRLRRYEFYNWNSYFKRKWMMISISTLIGAASHLLWDGFTHENGYFVQSIPLLSKTITISNIIIEVPMLLQVISSLCGLVVIFYAIWQLPADSRSTINFKPYTFWKYVFLIAALIYFIRVVFGISHEIEDLIIPAISAVILSIIITCTLLKYSLISLKMNR